MTLKLKLKFKFSPKISKNLNITTFTADFFFTLSEQIKNSHLYASST